MAETTGELRRDLDDQRDEIARTVDEIQNRVSPGRVWARGSFRMRHRVTDWKDQIMGNDQPYYSSGYRSGSSYGSEAGGSTVGDRFADAKESVAGAPEALRRQTQGNPLAAGLIAFGAGLLVSSLIPETEQEQKLAEGVQPFVSDVVGEARQAAQSVAQELKEPAEQAMQQVKDVAQQAASDVRDTAQSGVEEVRKQASSES
jgi:gas vesicle protein